MNISESNSNIFDISLFTSPNTHIYPLFVCLYIFCSGSSFCFLLTYLVNQFYHGPTEDLNDEEPVKDVKPVLSPEQIYTAEKHQKFNTMFYKSLNEETETEKHTYDIVDSKWNQNVDTVFYNKKECLEYFKEENSAVETLWKSRILLETTPRGNVIMFYNAYKQGFTYYSDTYMPYSILNAIAMKYTMTYKCVDFFIDNQVVPEEHTSPILKLLMDEEKMDQEKKNTAIQSIMPNAISSKDDVKKALPFAKLKNYKTTATKVNQTVEQKALSLKNKSSVKETYNNKFVYMGKIQNWCPIQRIPTQKQVFLKNKMSIFSNTPTSFDAVFDNAQSLQTQVLDYKSFKSKNTI